MSLKLEVESLDGMDENLQSLYEEQEGKYRLKVDGLPDVEKVEGKRKIEAEHRKKAEARAAEIEEELNGLRAKLESIETDGHRKKGDVEALEKSWQDKLSKREQELMSELETRDGWLKQQMVTGVANSLAAEIAVQGSAKALIPHIERRLSMEIREGNPSTVVLDSEGKPSANTVEELKTEFVNDPALSLIHI